MQSGRHIDTAVVVVGAAERYVFGGEIGANFLEENSQIHSLPLPDIIPTFNTHMPDDDFLLRQRCDPLCGPGLLVGDAAAKLEFPARAIDRLDVLDVEKAVVARRFYYVGLGESGGEMGLTE